MDALRICGDQLSHLLKNLSELALLVPHNLLTNSELCVLLFADKKTNAVCKKKLIMKF